MFQIPKKIVFIIIAIILFLVIVSFFDRALAIGIFLLFLLTGITLLILSRVGVKDKVLIFLFLITLLIHLFATLFVHYAHFYPFGGGEGDQEKYHRAAIELSQRFRQGDFSIKGFGGAFPELYVDHYYPVILGGIYALTLPEMIIGKLLNVWLVAISVVLFYLIIIEIGGLKKNAFFGGLLIAIYPSYLYYGSLLLREGFVISLALFSILFAIKLIRNFSWRRFLVFYIGLGLLVHFRFYIGYAFFPAFLISIPFISNLNLKKKIIYGIIIIILLGFLPQIFSNQGYYGINSFKLFFNSGMVTYFREVAYNYIPPYLLNQFSSQPSPQTVPAQSPNAPSPPPLSAPQSFSSGTGSTKILKTDFNKPLTFIKEYFDSFINVFLGPFPWQIKYSRQLFILLETIPWYFLLFFIVRGVISLARSKKIKLALPSIIFSFTALAVTALFMASNFGVYSRIRIPAFVSLLCLADFNVGILYYISSFLSKVKFFKFFNDK